MSSTNDDAVHNIQFEHGSVVEVIKQFELNHDKAGIDATAEFDYDLIDMRSGEGTVTWEDQLRELVVGEQIRIPGGITYQLKAGATSDLMAMVYSIRLSADEKRGS